MTSASFNRVRAFIGYQQNGQPFTVAEVQAMWRAYAIYTHDPSVDSVAQQAWAMVNMWNPTGGLAALVANVNRVVAELDRPLYTGHLPVGNKMRTGLERKAAKDREQAWRHLTIYFPPGFRPRTAAEFAQYMAGTKDNSGLLKGVALFAVLVTAGAYGAALNAGGGTIGNATFSQVMTQAAGIPVAPVPAVAVQAAPTVAQTSAAAEVGGGTLADLGIGSGISGSTYGSAATNLGIIAPTSSPALGLAGATFSPSAAFVQGSLSAAGVANSGMTMMEVAQKIPTGTPGSGAAPLPAASGLPLGALKDQGVKALVGMGVAALAPAPARKPAQQPGGAGNGSGGMGAFLMAGVAILAAVALG